MSEPDASEDLTTTRMMSEDTQPTAQEVHARHGTSVTHEARSTVGASKREMDM